MESQEVETPDSGSTETTQIDLRGSSSFSIPQSSIITPIPCRSRKKQNNLASASHDIVTKRKGKLRCAVELPIDVLLEIFGWLEPLDLHHISYATKDLRAICRNRQVWKLASKNVFDKHGTAPPLCPMGVNPLHYANFIFGSFCQFCASKGRILHLTARVRLCSKCISGVLILHQDLDDKGASSMCSPWFFKKTGKKQGYYVLRIEYQRNVEALATLVDDELARNDYIKLRQIECKERIEYAKLLQGWLLKVDGIQQQKSEVLHNQRQHEIEQRLLRAGFDRRELRQMGEIPGVRVAAKLTDKEWDKISGDVMKALFQRRIDVRRQMLEQLEMRIRHPLWIRLVELSSFIENRFKKPCIILPTTDLARIEPYHSLIKKTPLHIEVSRSKLEEYAHHIPRIMDLWKIVRGRTLLRLFPPTLQLALLGVGTLGIRALELGITFFKCSWCQSILTYPRVLMHGCLRNRHFDEDVDQKFARLRRGISLDLVWNAIPHWFCGGWNEFGNQISFYPEVSYVAQTLIPIFGKNPFLVPASELDKDDARTECLLCRSLLSDNQTYSRLVMNWRMAILHQWEVHEGSGDVVSSVLSWQLLSDEEAQKARETEKAEREQWEHPIYFCIKCHKYEVNTENYQRHLRTHKVDVTMEDFWERKHIYCEIDIPMNVPPFPVRIFI